MKILFDGRIFQFQRAGGINRYFAELITRLPEPWTPVVTGVRDFGEHAPVNPRLLRLTPPLFRPHRLREIALKRWWVPRLLRSARIVHPTYYDLIDGVSFAELSRPVVLTVYDLIYVKFAKLMEGSEAVIRAQAQAVARADQIICISHSTERDLLEFFPLSRGKTTVIHLATSYPPLDAASIAQAARERDDRSFLFVGGRSGYKNFVFLLRSFARAVTSNPSLRLTVAGAPLSSDERWELHRLGIEHRVDSVVYPSSVELHRLYLRSGALLYPSLYEGFGLPPLEAMATGTLAVTANSSSLPEVVGDAGVLLDPTNSDLWTDCILQIAAGFPNRARLIDEGLQRVGQFNWQQTVKNHLAVYSMLL
jgi:glycosyltransferase involved in cell wall biosynthesis